MRPQLTLLFRFSQLVDVELDLIRPGSSVTCCRVKHDRLRDFKFVPEATVEEFPEKPDQRCRESEPLSPAPAAADTEVAHSLRDGRSWVAILGPRIPYGSLLNARMEKSSKSQSAGQISYPLINSWVLPGISQRHAAPRPVRPPPPPMPLSCHAASCQKRPPPPKWARRSMDIENFPVLPGWRSGKCKTCITSSSGRYGAFGIRVVYTVSCLATGRPAHVRVGLPGRKEPAWYGRRARRRDVRPGHARGRGTAGLPGPAVVPGSGC